MTKYTPVDETEIADKRDQCKISPAADIAAHGKLTLALFFFLRIES